MLIYDAHARFDLVLDNAPAYWFKNNTSMNGTGDFWWNNYHPETAFHQRLARDTTTNLTELGWCTGGECL
jgi:hypothetical protein